MSKRERARSAGAQITQEGNHGRGTTAEVAPQADERSRSATFAQRLRAGARALRGGWMQVCGIPDYERYLAHHAEHHPDDAVLTRRDFFVKAIDRKYSKSGPRCC